MMRATPVETSQTTIFSAMRQPSKLSLQSYLVSGYDIARRPVQFRQRSAGGDV